MNCRKKVFFLKRLESLKKFEYEKKGEQMIILHIMDSYEAVCASRRKRKKMRKFQELIVTTFSRLKRAWKCVNNETNISKMISQCLFEDMFNLNELILWKISVNKNGFVGLLWDSQRFADLTFLKVT